MGARTTSCCSTKHTHTHRLSHTQTHTKHAQVVTGARTTKLVFDKAGAQPQAVGVEFSQGTNAASERVTAQLAQGGEVLMCSGTIHTPHILQLSGMRDFNHVCCLSLCVCVALDQLPNTGTCKFIHVICNSSVCVCVSVCRHRTSGQIEGARY